MRDISPPTQGLEPAALAMAAEIRARVGPDLFEGFEDTAGARSWPGPDRLWSKRGATPLFKAEVLLDAPPLVVAAVVKEADLGGLAGDLVHWRVGRISPFLELVHYVTRLPVPFSSRDFCVTERYGVESDGSVLILGQDLQDGDMPLVKSSLRAVAGFRERGCVRGCVRRSAYQISPVLRDGRVTTRLRRIVELDLCMWVPRGICERVIARHFTADFARLRGQIAGFRGSTLEKRTQADWFYRVVRGHAVA